MSENIKKFIDNLEVVLTSAEKFLDGQTDTVKSLALLSSISKDTGLSIEDVSKLDATIRFYIKTYSDYEITRGVNGGIRKKGTGTAPKTAKKKVKVTPSPEIKNLVEAKIASISSAQKTIEINTLRDNVSSDTDLNMDEDDEIIEEI